MTEIQILLLLYERVEISKWITQNCKYKKKAIIAQPAMEEEKLIPTKMPNTIAVLDDINLRDVKTHTFHGGHGSGTSSGFKKGGSSITTSNLPRNTVAPAKQ